MITCIQFNCDIKTETASRGALGMVRGGAQFVKHWATLNNHPQMFTLSHDFVVPYTAQKRYSTSVVGTHWWCTGCLHCWRSERSGGGGRTRWSEAARLWGMSSSGTGTVLPPRQKNELALVDGISLEIILTCSQIVQSFLVQTLNHA